MNEGERILYFKKKKFQSQTELILFDVRAMMMFALKKINTNHTKYRIRLLPTTEKTSSGWSAEFDVETASSYSNSKRMISYY